LSILGDMHGLRVCSLPLALAALAGPGCAQPTCIVLVVDATCGAAPCAVPDAVDELELSVFAAEPTEASGPEVSLASDRYALDGDTPFPVSVMLEPDADGPRRLRYDIILRKGGTRIAGAVVTAPWTPGYCNEVHAAVIAE
jgi:hypothetical protein